ncbi:unnamed protein product, partial [Choristocarpus tenellus]
MLNTFCEGREDGDTIIFIHGWPDDHTLWDQQVVAHLKSRFRCVTVDLPGFESPNGGKIKEQQRWGLDTKDVVHELEVTIESVARGKPVVLVAHDWGSLYGMLLEQKRPDLVSRMVALDVGGVVRPGLFGTLLLVTYQGWLVLAFLLGWPIGNAMARLVAYLFRAPSYPRRSRSWAFICYPYWRFWVQLSTGKASRPLMPSCPLLYLHGSSGMKKYL